MSSPTTSYRKSRKLRTSASPRCPALPVTNTFMKVSSHLAGCEKPLFILEPLGVEFGALPDFLFGAGGAGELHAAFLNESRTSRQRPV
jgi:hypothetical protein